jgi:DNA-3-methyladenine glycosylase
MTRLITNPRFERFRGDAVTVARRLLGQRLVRIDRDVRMAGTIVEVEAYLGAEDRAAHTFGGRRTQRNESMFLPAGHAYVYFTYGMHYCFNVVCGAHDEGTAVLIRAIEPTEGLEAMAANRPAARREIELCAGPARLTQALRIDRDLDGVDMRTSAHLYIEQLRTRPAPKSVIEATRRVGVEYAGEWGERQLRFYLRDSAFVSRRSWR